MRQKGFSPIVIVVGILLISTVALGAYYLGTKNNKPTTQADQSATNLSPTPVASSAPTKVADSTSNLEIYTSQAGKYSFNYPDSVKIYINEQMSADGVKAPVIDTTTLVSDVIPQLKTNYQLSINHKIPSEANLKDFIDRNSTCAEVQSGKAKVFTLGGKPAAIFENTPCGLSGMTVIYAVNNGVGYIIEIESQASYNELAKFTDQILSTFKFTN